MPAFDPVSLAIEGGAAVIGGIVSAIGAAVAQGDYDKARDLRAKAAAEYGDDILPKLDKATAQEVGPTAFAAINEDQGVRQNNVDAMRKLSELYDRGGQGPGDEAALRLADMGVARQGASQYSALQQQLAARGQSGNPALMAATAASLGGSTASALAQNRYQAQADARQRAMQALGMSADIGSGVRNADYRLSSDRASASDRINQFNAGQRTNADLENARRAQAMSDSQFRLADSRSNAYNNQASAYDASGNRTRQTYAGVGNAIGTLGASMAGGMGGQSDPYGQNNDYSGGTVNNKKRGY